MTFVACDSYLIAYYHFVHHITLESLFFFRIVSYQYEKNAIWKNKNDSEKPPNSRLKSRECGGCYSNDAAPQRCQLRSQRKSHRE